MGLYDRPYLHDDDSSRAGGWSGARTMVLNLILINAGLWIADAFTSQHQLIEALSLKADLLQHPWNVWQLLSYGFVHSPNVSHVLFNMFMLWVFGSEVEALYGRLEFLRIYLVSIVIAGLAWLAMSIATGGQGLLIGASGGVMAIAALFAFNFPRRQILLMGIIPLQAWMLVAFYVVGDVVGAIQRDPENSVANIAHLGGFAFGAAYFHFGLNLGRFLPGNWQFKSPFRPKLRIHEPREATDDLSEQVDAILEKIHSQGEASLTKKERRTLEEASKRYQKRRQ